ncbi:hypothetical protein P9E34_14205 [Schinkia azotoformans]|uniref:hypothetical protein n=1 Tax=Schinkia azotoformans TaxID=1454 RepID=UPI002DBCCCF9|nr:hypothetical protein [Schinkia azotoformans]MEC1725867.1 hypothetical protein [Schinkia azotoformans]
MSNDKWELHQELISETKESCTIASYIRRKGSDDDWYYISTVTHFIDGSIEWD